MSQALLETALKGYDIQWRVPIWREISKHGSTLYGGASERDLLLIAQDLAQVSGGSGLDLIGLLLLSEDASDSDLAKNLICDVQWRLNRYVPGTVYGLNTEVPPERQVAFS